MTFFFGLVAVLTAAQFRERLPDDRGDSVRARVEYFRKHSDAIDVLFVGPSYTRDGILNDVFDEEFAKLGLPVRSFSVAVANLGGDEAFALLEKLRPSFGKKLKFILFDVTLARSTIAPENAYKLRSLYWLNWNAIVSLLRYPPGHWQADLYFAQLKTWTVHYLMRVLSIGAGLNLIRDAFVPTGTSANFQWFPEPTTFDLAEFTRLKGKLESFWEDREKSACGDRRPFIHFVLTRMQTLRSQLREQGIEVLYVVSPVTYPWVCAPQEEEARQMGILALNNPARYPKLFAPAIRRDNNHFTFKGAEAYSKFLANKAAPALTPFLTHRAETVK